MSYTVIDIETDKADDAVIFQPTDFKIDSRLTDPVKKRAAYAIAKSKWENECPLDPITGKILVIGITDYKDDFKLLDGSTNEEDMLKEFWEIIEERIVRGHKIVGHNIKGFDFPFINIRSWKHGIVPLNVCNENGYFKDYVVDTMKMVAMGRYQTFVSLDKLSKFLGVGAKSDMGKYFGKVFRENREEAIEYLKNDLWLTKECYIKMQATKAATPKPVIDFLPPEE